VRTTAHERDLRDVEPQIAEAASPTSTTHPQDRTAELGETALSTSFLAVTLVATGAPFTGALMIVPAAAYAVAWHHAGTRDDRSPQPSKTGGGQPGLGR
jgi:hypothetical protein